MEIPCTRTFHPQTHNWLYIICGAHMDEEKSSSCIIFVFSSSSLAAFCRSRARACSSSFSSLPLQLQCRGILDTLPEAWYVFELTYSMLQIECMILFYFNLQIFYFFRESILEYVCCCICCHGRIVLCDGKMDT